MHTFKEFITELRADPVALANRAASIYGKKEKYGKWLKAERGKHIPLKTYNSKETDIVARKNDKVYTKLGQKQYFDSHEKKTFDIKHLHPTQPFVKTADQDKLKAKISDANPDHIRILTHNGKSYVADGHHAVMGAVLRGEKTITAYHLNLDQH